MIAAQERVEDSPIDRLCRHWVKCERSDRLDTTDRGPLSRGSPSR